MHSLARSTLSFASSGRARTATRTATASVSALLAGVCTSSRTDVGAGLSAAADKTPAAAEPERGVETGGRLGFEARRADAGLISGSRGARPRCTGGWRCFQVMVPLLRQNAKFIIILTFLSCHEE